MTPWRSLAGEECGVIQPWRRRVGRCLAARPPRPFGPPRSLAGWAAGLSEPSLADESTAPTAVTQGAV